MKNFARDILLGAVVFTFLLAGGAALLRSNSPSPSQNVGSFSPTGGTTYRLASDVGYTDTSIRLTSFSEPVSGIPYTMTYLNSSIEYATLAPQTSHSEFIVFTGITQNTDGSATLTGVTRGLARTPGTGGCVASSTLEQPHAAQTILILSNPPCFYLNFVTNTTGNSNVISSTNKFASTTFQGFDLDPGAAYFTSAASSTFIDQAQLNRAVLTGCANGTTILQGCVQLATARQAASSTVLGSTGANDIIASSYATDTPSTSGCGTSSGGCVVMSLLNAKISQTWLDLTKAFAFSGAVTSSAGLTSSATTTLTCSNVNSNGCVFNTLAYAWPASQTANTFLKTDGSGNLTWGNPPVSLLVNNPNNGSSTISTSNQILAWTTVPAGTLNTTNKTMEIKGYWVYTSGTCTANLIIGNGTASSTIVSDNSATLEADAMLDMTSSSNAYMATSSISSTIKGTSSSTSLNLGNQFYVEWGGSCTGGSGPITLYLQQIKVLTQ